MYNYAVLCINIHLAIAAVMMENRPFGTIPTAHLALFRAYVPKSSNLTRNQKCGIIYATAGRGTQ
jgi:hypothetical protein